MNTRLGYHLVAALLGVVFTVELHAVPLTFTYQGHLTDNGMPANGLYDFKFELWYTKGSVGVTTNSAVTVSNGLFTVELDFGYAFDSSPLSLEIGVRTNGVGPFDTLSPRQALTSTPYAIQAANASVAELVSGDISANQLTSGHIPSDRLLGTYSNVLAFNNNFNTFNGTFMGDGAGLLGIHSLDAADGSPTKALYVDNDGNVGVRTNNPVSALHVAGTVTADAFEGSVAANQLSGTIPVGNLPANPSFEGTVTATSFLGSGDTLTNVNADLLDGVDSTQFLRSDMGGSISGNLTVNGTISAGTGGIHFADGSVQTNATVAPLQIVRDFMVADGASVAAGDVVSLSGGTIQKGLAQGTNLTLGAEGQFYAAGTRGLSVAALSATKIVVAFKADDFFNRAVIGDISDTTITFGAPVLLSGSSSSFDNLPIPVAALTSNKFVVAYQDVGNGDRGTARIGEVSGTAITLGSNVVFNLGTTYDSAIGIATLAPNKFVVAFQDGGNSYYGTAIVGDVSTNFVSFGTKKVFSSNACYTVRPVKLAPDKFAVTYQRPSLGRAIIGTVSGLTITYGAEATFETVEARYSTSAALDSSQFIVAYDMITNSVQQATAVVGAVSGSTIVFGPKAVFDTNAFYYFTAAAFSPNKVLIAYSGNGKPGTAVVGAVSGATLAFGSPLVFNATNTWFSSATCPSSDKAVFVCLDQAAPFYGDYRVGLVSLAPGAKYIGIAKTAGSSGQTMPVVVGGVSTAHSGLAPEAYYYADDDGNLVTWQTEHKVGLSLSDTEILLTTGFGF